jgi:hypothetical protein
MATGMNHRHVAWMFGTKKIHKPTRNADDADIEVTNGRTARKKTSIAATVKRPTKGSVGYV